MTKIETRSETGLLTAADLLRLDAEGVRGELQQLAAAAPVLTSR